ncbi:MAG: RNA polymerase sigma factor [Hydrogenovibrio crunogenus]|uniref:Sigma-24 (FecI-like) n=1 Tax=Hydrogenovibrio crunogenus (strain DSM 25203 / XCL-2) TaxID=317025 RepID=Q31DM9_HYDCU|nr:RNA polymerase sigma factor [Hydrogenovibrio crunogenus]
MIGNWVKLKTNQVKLNAVLESNYANLYRIAYAWSQDESLAQDLVQDTMLKSLQKADQVESFENVDRWLCKIMHNLFYDNCRQSARWQQVNVDDCDEQLRTESIETLYIHKQTIRNIHAAIGSLPIDQREVIVLVDLQGYSYQEVAEIAEVPVGTVMSRLSRGRAKLKKLVTSEKFIPNYANNIVDLKKSNSK